MEFIICYFFINLPYAIVGFFYHMFFLDIVWNSPYVMFLLFYHKLLLVILSFLKYFFNQKLLLIILSYVIFGYLK